jgi:uncharacterized protein YlxW (UPF0749 family)
MAHYKVVNTTRKPGVKKGPHRLGFFVALGDKRPFGPGKSHVVTEITPGILNLQQKGYISIEPVKDIDVVIKKQIEENDKAQKEEEKKRTAALIHEKKDELDKVKSELEEVKKPKAFAEDLSTGLDKEGMKERAKKSHGRVTAAKVDGEGVDPLGDLEESVNPDGDPNFVVTAKSKRRRN